MQKVFMRRLNDCYTCCLATLLSEPYENVPLCYDKYGNLYQDWELRIKNFLAAKGLQVIRSTIAPDQVFLIEGAVIVGGLSYTPEHAARGDMHAVIYNNGELWHDPKQDPSGVIVPTEVDIIFPIFKVE